MGERVNYVVIRDGNASAYYSQWGADGCIYDFACGPAQAENAASAMEETEELMDWAFAEGGYLLDFDEKVGIVFSMDRSYEDFEEEEEEDSGFPPLDIPKINEAFDEGPPQFLECIAPAWKGWTLVWDGRGVDGFAEYLKKRSITSIAVTPFSHPEDTPPPVVIKA